MEITKIMIDHPGIQRNLINNVRCKGIFTGFQMLLTSYARIGRKNGPGDCLASLGFSWRLHGEGVVGSPGYRRERTRPGEQLRGEK